MKVQQVALNPPARLVAHAYLNDSGVVVPNWSMPSYLPVGPARKVRSLRFQWTTLRNYCLTRAYSTNSAKRAAGC